MCVRRLPELPPPGKEALVSVIETTSPEAEVIGGVRGYCTGSAYCDAELVDGPVVQASEGTPVRSDQIPYDIYIMECVPAAA